MKVFPIKLHNDKMETIRILMTSNGKDRWNKLHSVSCEEMLVDFESKLGVPDEFVAESMSLPSNFAVKKYVCGRIENFDEVAHQPRLYSFAALCQELPPR